MKKLSASTKLFISAVIIIFAVNFINYFYVSKNVLHKAFILYEKERYEEALDVLNNAERLYKDNNLYFNMGQIYYKLKQYNTALSYTENSDNSVGKFILLGNIYLNTANEIEDGDSKNGVLYKALEVLMEGMMKYPEEVTLKYNYEYIERLLSNPFSDDGDEEKEQDENQEEEEQEQEEQEQEEQEQNENNEGNNEENNEENSSGDEGGNQTQPDSGDQDPDSGDQEAEKSDHKTDRAPDVLDLLEKKEETAFKENQNHTIEGQVSENDW